MRGACRPITPLVVSILVAACSGGSGIAASPVALESARASGLTPTVAPSASAPATPSAASLPSADPVASATGVRTVTVGKERRRLAYACWGEGSPTVVLETGGANIAEWVGSGVVRRLAGETRVCTYDRAGTGSSDPPPYERRDADDVVSDLKALLAAAHLDGPYVLLGQSFGGMIVSHYAETEPDGVIGVIILDSPAPSATFTPESEPELVWDYPGNTERLDVVGGFENRFAKDPPKVGVPVLVISPIPGEGSAQDESFWLQVGPKARQVGVGCSGGATEGRCADEVATFVEGLG